MKPTIAFLGLGIMGSRMAANLLGAGHTVHVYNRSTAATAPLATLGGTVHTDPSAAVGEADVVFSMLAHPNAVTDVMLNRGLAAMKPGATWVDCSTVDPAFSRSCDAQARETGVRFLGAPVAGTLPHAEQAQLTFFVGGEAEVLEAVRPLLDLMGQGVVHVGGAGQGAAYKMLVNGLLANAIAAFSETVHLGEKLGIDRSFLLNNLSKSVVAAPVTAAKAPAMEAGEYPVMFPLEWMHKDLQLVASAAFEVAHPMPITHAVKETYARAQAQGLGRLDFAAVHESLRGSK